MRDVQCKCVIELASGESVRCKQMVHDPSKSDYCYFHGKQLDDPKEPKGCPAPRGVDDPDRVAGYRKHGSPVMLQTFKPEEEVVFA